jgi:hypothetical protein
MPATARDDASTREFTAAGCAGPRLCPITMYAGRDSQWTSQLLGDSSRRRVSALKGIGAGAAEMAVRSRQRPRTIGDVRFSLKRAVITPETIRPGVAVGKHAEPLKADSSNAHMWRGAMRHQSRHFLHGLHANAKADRCDDNPSFHETDRPRRQPPNPNSAHSIGGNGGTPTAMRELWQRGQPFVMRLVVRTRRSNRLCSNRRP